MQFHNWFIYKYDKYDGITIKNLFVPSAGTSNYGLKQLRVNGPRIWNALPTYLKTESSFNVFMKNLKFIIFGDMIRFIIVYMFMFVFSPYPLPQSFFLSLIIFKRIVKHIFVASFLDKNEIELILKYYIGVVAQIILTL